MSRNHLNRFWGRIVRSIIVDTAVGRQLLHEICIIHDGSKEDIERRISGGDS